MPWACETWDELLSHLYLVNLHTTNKWVHIQLDPHSSRVFDANEDNIRAAHLRFKLPSARESLTRKNSFECLISDINGSFMLQDLPCNGFWFGPCSPLSTRAVGFVDALPKPRPLLREPRLQLWRLILNVQVLFRNALITQLILAPLDTSVRLHA